MLLYINAFIYSELSGQVEPVRPAESLRRLTTPLQLADCADHPAQQLSACR
eukprot:COSAG06_NODE_749_length_12615_cov_35.521333_3_plen_51_part_00